MFRLPWALALMLLTTSPLHAEVVLQNTTTGTGTTGSSAGDFAINFTAPADAMLAGITLYNANSLSTFNQLTWYLIRGETLTWTRSFTSAALVSGNTITGNGGSTRYGYYFDFTASASPEPLQPANYTLHAQSLNNRVSGWSITDSSMISVTNGSGFSNAIYVDTSEPLYNFQLSTAAVPEPGTFVLGVLAAAAGALAWWWRTGWYPAG